MRSGVYHSPCMGLVVAGYSTSGESSLPGQTVKICAGLNEGLRLDEAPSRMELHIRLVVVDLEPIGSIYIEVCCSGDTRVLDDCMKGNSMHPTDQEFHIQIASVLFHRSGSTTFCGTSRETGNVTFCGTFREISSVDEVDCHVLNGF